MVAKTSSHSIITTKLSAPECDGRLITRRALFDAFVRTQGSILTVVAAAGSGKSTLLAEIHQSLASSGTGLGWISLDPDDDTPSNFATYLVAALIRLDPGAKFDDLMLQGRTPFRDIEPLFRRLLAHVSNLPRDAVLFLDDFQHIQNDVILFFLNKLLASAPPTLRVVIASRQRIPLDLSRFRLRNRLIDVQQEDLSFSAQQAYDFLKLSHGVDLGQKDLALLLETTEGWPTGLQLAGLALRKHASQTSQLIEKFSGRDRDLSSYLMEVVLRSQPEAVRQFLLATAPLTRMSAGLAAAVSGHPNGAAMIEHLSRANLFVIALDREGGWYRYHHLFSSFLQDQVTATDPTLLSRVFERASTWCEAQGLTTEAIQYALDGQHYDRACDLIATHAATLTMRQGDHYTVLEWMRRLPERYHLRTPELALAHAWARAFSRDSDRATAIADRVLQQLRSQDGWNLPHQAVTEQSFVARVIQVMASGANDEINNAIELGIALRKELGDDRPFLTSSICNTLSYGYFARQEFELSARTASEAYRAGHRAGVPYPTVWAIFLQGVAALEMGHVRSAFEHSGRAVDCAHTAESSRGYSSAMAALLSAEVALQRCDLDRAAEFMGLGRSFTATFGPLYPLFLAYRIDARLSALRGEPDHARRILMDGQDTALSMGQPRLYLNLAIEEVTLRLNAGDITGAMESVARTQLLEDRTLKQATTFRGEHDALKLLRARLALANGDAALALRLITMLLQQQPSTGSVSFALTLRAVRAHAMWADQRPSDAIRELDKALSSAALEQHAYPIAHAGPGLIPILKAIVERRGDAPLGGDLRVKRALESTLLTTLSTEDQSLAIAATGAALHDAKPTETLTDREIELLRLVEAGLANKQLADALLISESTVKWHLHNIYSKIGVGSRTAAVARARELTMLK